MSKEQLEEIKEWHENDGEMHQFQIDWLIEQAEQNYRIQKENAKLSIMLRTAQSDLFDIQQQNKRYREAMKEALKIAKGNVLSSSACSDIEVILNEALEGSE